jgi:tetratricopeptide (TPR) repeat protein
MNKNFFFSLSVALWLGSAAWAAASQDWIQCWMTGVELSKNQNDYPEALKAYTAAIKADPSQISNHLYLYNERGKLCLKMQEFNQAIQDFSFVLGHNGANREEMLDALWGRGQAYLAMGKTEEFEKDRKQLDALEPFVTTLEDNPDYLIVKMGSHVWRDPQSRERFVKILLTQKKIRTKQDVTFTPSGLAIIKKAKSSVIKTVP